MSETRVAVENLDKPVVEDEVIVDSSADTNSDVAAAAAETSSDGNATNGDVEEEIIDKPVVDEEIIDKPVEEEIIDKPVDEKVIESVATRSIRILKEGDEKADGETIYTVIGDDVIDSDGNPVTDEDLKNEILAKVQSGGRRRSRHNRRNGHRQSKKRQQKRQSKKQKQNGGKKRRNSKRNQKK